MKKTLLAIALLINLVQDIFGQQFTKTISRNYLEMYLSKSVNAQSLNDLLKTADGFYPSTSIKIVHDAEMTSNPPVGSVDYIRKNDRLNGNMYNRYTDMLRLVSNVGAKFITDAVSHWGA